MILWKNATFYTMNNEDEIIKQVITNKGFIVALGDECNNFKVDKVIDLNKAFVFPGFTDSHIHLIGYGRKLLSKNLNLEKDYLKALKQIKLFYNNEPLKIEGYYNIGITKDDLDKISKDHYIILRHSDYHSFTVNSKVLNDLKINSLNGIITDDLISNKIKVIWENNNNEKLKVMANEAIKQLIKYGITSIHTDDLAYFNSYLETLNILDEVASNNKFRINTLIHNEILDDYFTYYPNNKFLKDIQIKYFYDGTITSKTAYLSDYYYNTNIKGNVYLDQDLFIKQLIKIRSINKGVAVHVIGDQALDDVLKILSKYPSTGESDRIVHASLSKKATSLKNIAVDIQPLFKISDEKFINENIKYDVLIYPFNKYNNETIINSSSDAPVENPNPLLSMFYLTNEISRFEAIKSYTVNPYLTIHQKGGIIKKGYYADFTCFDKDIMKIKKEELLQTKVLYTIIDEDLNII